MRPELYLGALTLVLVGCSDPGNHADGEARTTTHASAVDPVATLAEARGDVRHRAARTGAWADAEPSLGLRPEDLVQTMANGRATIRFVDGASAALDPNTTLQIPQQPPEVRRLEHLSGRLVARVSGQDGQRMEVELPPGTLILDPRDAADDRAVVAQLNVEEGQTRIDLVEGRGVLRRERGDELRVDTASYVALDDEGTVLEEGALGDPVQLLEPAAGAVVQVRRRVELSWRPHPQAELYQVHLEPEEGEPILAEVTEPRVALDLPSGVYRWTVRAYREERGYPPSEARVFELEVDRQPPRLVLSSPAAGATVEGAAVTIAGETEPGARLEVDGRPVDVGSDGRFRTSHPVPRGLVNVVIRAVDSVGNQRVVSRSVVRP